MRVSAGKEGKNLIDINRLIPKERKHSFVMLPYMM